MNYSNWGQKESVLEIELEESKSGGCLVAPLPESRQHRLSKRDILIITEPIIGDQKHSVALMALPE